MAVVVLCGVLSLWIFRLAGRYSLSIGGVAAAPRGGPAISLGQPFHYPRLGALTGTIFGLDLRPT